MEIPKNGAAMDPYENGGRWTKPEEALRAVHRNRMAHEIVQQVIGECPYIGTARDDETWWNLHTLQEQNALPDGYTADDLYNLYRTNYGGENA